MKLTLSNSLIIICAIFTLASFQNPEILQYSMHNYFLERKDYADFVIQILFYSFLHDGFLHLLFNSVFIYIFGNKVEIILGEKMYALLLIFTILFTPIFILLSGEHSLGFSNFGMAILSYYTAKLYHEGNSEYKAGITAIIIYILMGLSGEISLGGHLGGAVIGGVFFGITRIIKRS